MCLTALASLGAAIALILINCSRQDSSDCDLWIRAGGDSARIQL